MMIIKSWYRNRTNNIGLNTWQDPYPPMLIVFKQKEETIVSSECVLSSDTQEWVTG